MRFNCSDFNGNRAFTAEDLGTAAGRVANRIARRDHGRRCYPYTCNLNSWSVAGGRMTLGHYQATICHRGPKGSNSSAVDGEAHFTIRIVED